MDPTSLAAIQRLHVEACSCFPVIDDTLLAWFRVLRRHLGWHVQSIKISCRHRGYCSLVMSKGAMGIPIYKLFSYKHGKHPVTDCWTLGFLVFVLLVIFVTQVGIDSCQVYKEEKDLLPPFLWFSVNGMVGPELVISVDSTHVFTVVDDCRWCFNLVFLPLHIAICTVLACDKAIFISVPVVCRWEEMKDSGVVPNRKCQSPILPDIECPSLSFGELDYCLQICPVDWWIWWHVSG